MKSSLVGMTVATLFLAACGGSSSDIDGGKGEPGGPTPTPLPELSPTPTPEPARVTHFLGEFVLAPGQEVASQCVSWTLGNEEALYVQAVTLSNPGASHHSNWFVVPEDLYPGPDGYFDCNSRDFSEIGSAVAGTVIFAQSTQSLLEVQRFRPGAVIKVPPRHKVVAGVHFLNLSARELHTGLRMTLELLHPREVEAILSPFRFSYYALDVPPRSEQRYAIECDMASAFEEAAGRPFDMKLHWVLPHTHALGNHFRVEVVGGKNDGRVLHELDTFNGDANGMALDPPIDLSDAGGLRVVCGFRNPRDESIGWGVGDQEMCVMLGLAETAIMMDLSVDETTDASGVDGGIPLGEGPCSVLAVPRNVAQGPPTDAELAAELCVPPTAPDDIGLPPVPPCEDTPVDAVGESPATFSSIRDTIFVSSCNYAACHGSVTPAAGLDLEAREVSRLVSAASATAVTAMPLVVPGDPEGSWLYRVLSRCTPLDDEGSEFAHMPRNSPTLLAPALVAKVRDWILAGAADD
ncbi:MAG: hypothetical protein ABGY42_03810 [bacterium]